MARELMAITGLTAQTLVDLARSAFAGVGGAVGASSNAASAASLGIFLTDGVTGDGMGMSLLGRSSPYAHTHSCTFVRITLVH